MLGMIGFGGETFGFVRLHFGLIYVAIFFPFQFFIKTSVGETLRATRNSKWFYGEAHFKNWRSNAATPQKPLNCKAVQKEILMSSPRWFQTAKK